VLINHLELSFFDYNDRTDNQRRNIAQTIKNQVAEEVNILLKKHKIQPKITTIKIGNDPSSDLYLKLRITPARK